MPGLDIGVGLAEQRLDGGLMLYRGSHELAEPPGHRLDGQGRGPGSLVEPRDRVDVLLGRPSLLPRVPLGRPEPDGGNEVMHRLRAIRDEAGK